MLSLAMGNLVLVAAFYGLTLIFYALRKIVPDLELAPKKANYPLISIIVPARNEETKILRCLNSLLNQSYPNYELIVIDDRSDDATGTIIEGLARLNGDKLKMVKGIEAPDGWVGKCNAICNAVAYASGQYYVFTDADTYHDRDSIFKAYNYLRQNQIDLVSFIPVQEFGSFPERVVMPILLSSFLLGDTFHAVNEPLAHRAYAYGQYIMCSRTSYEAIGGHQSVRDEIVEDHALGKVFKDNGFKIAVACGRGLYQVRMYNDLKSLWYGWTKNLYSLVDSSVLNVALLLFFVNFVVLFPFLNLAYITLTLTGQFLNHELTLNYELIYLTQVTLSSLVVLTCWFRQTSTHFKGLEFRHFFLLPVGCLYLSALYIHSAYLVLGGQEVNWKGRKYRVNSAKTIEFNTNVLEALKKSYLKITK